MSEKELEKRYEFPKALETWIMRHVGKVGACGSAACYSCTPGPHCDCHTDAVWNAIEVKSD